MNILNCPITGEKILSAGQNGVTKRENYAEVWFILSDGSRMRVAMSKAAKDNLTEKQADALFKSISKDWRDAVKAKAIDEEQREIQLGRISGLVYKSVEAKTGVMITKK